MRELIDTLILYVLVALLLLTAWTYAPDIAAKVKARVIQTNSIETRKVTL